MPIHRRTLAVCKAGNYNLSSSDNMYPAGRCYQR